MTLNLHKLTHKMPKLNITKTSNIIWVLLSLFCLYMLGSWFQEWRTPKQTVNTTVEALPATALQNIKKEAITLKSPVKVYAGGKKTKQKLNLPPSVINQESQHIIAGTQITARDDHPYTVTTVLDETTGESTSYITKEPLPWFAIDTRGSLGLYAGIKNGNPTARLEVKQSLAQIKNIHIRATANIDQTLQGNTEQEYFIGIGAEVHW